MANAAALFPLLLALATFSAVIYIVLGIRLGRRRVGEGARLANHAWQAWWIMLAMSTLLGTVFVAILGRFGLYDLPVALTIWIVNLLIVFGALLGLSYYLAFVVTGRQNIWKPLAWFYGLSVVGWLYTAFSARPIGTRSGDGAPEILYQATLDSQPLYGVLLLALLLPVMAAAAAYAYLGTKAPDRTIRFRIVLVAFSLFIWFGASLLATATSLADLASWPVISRLLSLSAAALIYVAHFPPRWVVARLGLRPILED